MKRKSSSIIVTVLLWVLVALSSISILAQDEGAADPTQEVAATEEVIADPTQAPAADPTDEAAQPTVEPTKEIIFVPVPTVPGGDGGVYIPPSSGFSIGALIDLATAPYRVVFLFIVIIAIIVGCLVVFVLREMRKQGNLIADSILKGLDRGAKFIPLEEIPKYLREFAQYTRTTETPIDNFLSDMATGGYEALTGTDIDAPPDPPAGSGELGQVPT